MTTFDRLDPVVLYEDEAILVVEKPSGLLSVPGRGPENQVSLISKVQKIHPDALIVHRLDMPTSGLMVLARSPEVHRALSMAFAAREVSKRYEALVAGRVEKDVGEVDLPLITDWPNRPRQMVDHQIGKPSKTLYEVLSRHEDHTRVSLVPVTGRSHQLRVHMMALGHPILGDLFYAPEDVCAKSERLLLHACDLGFDHPVTGKKMRFCSQVPF